MSAFVNDTVMTDLPIDVNDLLLRMFNEFASMKLRQEKLEDQLQLVKSDNEAMKLKLHHTENKVNLLERQLLGRNIMPNDDEAQSLREMRLTLRFKKEPSPRIYTGKEIKADDQTSLELELVDADSGKVVDSGAVANSEVGVVVLKGNDGDADNWTSQEFKASIVGERKGTKLGGNVKLRLNRGIGVIGDIKFVSSAKPTPQGVFKLGARLIGTFSGVHVREGKTGPFIVEDFRNERYEKHETPTLDDGLCRLKNISPKGKILKRLRERQIITVKDFLVQLFKDPEGLEQMVGLPKQKWVETVTNARNCLDKRLCYYIDPDMNMTVVFSLIDQVLGVVSSSGYITIDKLPYNEKENARRLAIRALDDWANVLFADDVASILNSVNLSISREQDNPIELELEGSAIMCDFSDIQFDATGFPSPGSGFSVVPQGQPAAPSYDHISLANTTVGSSFSPGLVHPKCLEIAPFGSQGERGDTGFNPTSGWNLTNNHVMVMPNVMHKFPSFNIDDVFRGIASSSFTPCSGSSSDLLVNPLRPQEEAMETFSHWNSVRPRSAGSWTADEIDSFLMENLWVDSSSSSNMALVKNTSWSRWLIVAYIMSVKWESLRSDMFNLAIIEEFMKRLNKMRASKSPSATFKLKKPRIQ